MMNTWIAGAFFFLLAGILAGVYCISHLFPLPDWVFVVGFIGAGAAFSIGAHIEHREGRP